MGANFLFFFDKLHIINFYSQFALIKAEYFMIKTRICSKMIAFSWHLKYIFHFYYNCYIKNG